MMNNKMTRRAFGKLSLVGATLFTLIGRIAIAANLKLLKDDNAKSKELGYIDKGSPKGKCKDCMHFGNNPNKDPDSCAIAPEYKVSPAGYCNMFAKK